MINKRNILFCALSVLLAGCSSVLVNLDYDSVLDFSTFKTYAWQYEEQPVTGNPRVDNDLNDQRIRRAVDVELREKGFMQVDKAEADLLVAYFMDYQMRIDSRGGSFSYGLGTRSAGRSGGVAFSTGTDISDYEEEQLTIDLLSSATEKTIWRGRGRSKTSNTSSPEKNEAKTHFVIKRVLESFPPNK